MPELSQQINGSVSEQSQQPQEGTKNKKPVFKHSKIWFLISAILSIPLLIDICTACRLFSLWIAWLLFFLILFISGVRLWFAFSQHLYKFAWGLIGQLLLGAALLFFFQLSINRVIETPVSHPVTPAVVNIVNPIIELDSVHKAQKADVQKEDKIKNHHSNKVK